MGIRPGATRAVLGFGCEFPSWFVFGGSEGGFGRAYLVYTTPFNVHLPVFGLDPFWHSNRFPLRKDFGLFKVV